MAWLSNQQLIRNFNRYKLDLREEVNFKIILIARLMVLQLEVGFPKIQFWQKAFKTLPKQKVST